TAAAPGLAVAAVAWLGYRTPQEPVTILTRGAARRGGAALDQALTGLAAARQALGTPDPRTTVLAHSYGTVVVGRAAAGDGRVAARTFGSCVAYRGPPRGASRQRPHVGTPGVRTPHHRQEHRAQQDREDR